MNLILLRQADRWLDPGCVEVSDHRATHIRQVLRAAAGDRLCVGLLGGNVGTAVVRSLDANRVWLDVQLDQPPPPRHRFDLVLALPRPKMLRRILRMVAEFGVSNLHLINSARVEKSYWQSPLLEAEKLEVALMAGLERSRDTVLPQVFLHPRFRPFVEDQLPDLCAGRPCWIADRGATVALKDQAKEPGVVMIGPEGGFVPFELALAQAVIARAMHLGTRTFSVDTALVAVLAQALPGC